MLLNGCFRFIHHIEVYMALLFNVIVNVAILNLDLH